MEVKLNEVSVLVLNTTKENVIKYDIDSAIFTDDMSRRLNWVLTDKYERCYERLRTFWEPILIARGAQSLPTDPDEFALLVFAEPDYKDRHQRDLEAGQ